MSCGNSLSALSSLPNQTLKAQLTFWFYQPLSGPNFYLFSFHKTPSFEATPTFPCLVPVNGTNYSCRSMLGTSTGVQMLAFIVLWIIRAHCAPEITGPRTCKCEAGMCSHTHTDNHRRVLKQTLQSHNRRSLKTHLKGSAFLW